MENNLRHWGGFSIEEHYTLFSLRKKKCRLSPLLYFCLSKVSKELWKWRGSWHYRIWSSSWKSFSKTWMVFSFFPSPWDCWFWWEHFPSHYTSVTSSSLSNKTTEKTILFSSWGWGEEGKHRDGKLENTLGKEDNAFLGSKSSNFVVILID